MCPDPPQSQHMDATRSLIAFFRCSLEERRGEERRGEESMGSD
jgi:hypothetical protein